MKVIAVIGARCTWLFNLADMNQKGLRLFPSLTEALIDKYDFDEQPEGALTERTKSSEPGIKLKNGQFESPQGIVKVSLDIFEDGIVAESPKSTDVTEMFIKDVISWVTSWYGLVFDPTLVKGRIYFSEIVVQFNSHISESMKPLRTFAGSLSEISIGDTGPQPYHLSGITFASAPGGIPVSIEQRANTPLEANVFYSKAAVDTATHLRLLGELDKILDGSRKPNR